MKKNPLSKGVFLIKGSDVGSFQQPKRRYGNKSSLITDINTENESALTSLGIGEPVSVIIANNLEAKLHLDFELWGLALHVYVESIQDLQKFINVHSQLESAFLKSGFRMDTPFCLFSRPAKK